MGLDASVFCNCYETGKARTPPPHPELIYVDKDGSLGCRDMDHFWELDEWLENRACEHKRGEAISHYIGNIALVAFLREELGKTPDVFPIILNKVIYNGIHGGDYISVDEVKKMQNEVAQLQIVHLEAEDDEKQLREFEKQLKELVDCSLHMNKPIVF